MNLMRKISSNENIENWYFGYAFQGAIVLGSLPILLPIIVKDHTNDAVAGIVVAMFFAGQLIAPLWGRIADGTRKLKLFYLIGYIFLGIGAFFFGFTHNEAFWIVLAFLQGMGAAATNTVSAMLIVEFNSKAVWNKKIGWLQTFYGVGQAAGLALAALCTLSPFYGIMISGLLMIPGFYFGSKNLPSEKHQEAGKAKCHLKGIDIIHGHPFSFVSHYHMPSGETVAKLAEGWKSEFGLFILIWLLVNISRGLVYDLYPLMMKSLFNIHPGISALFYAVAAAVCIFLYAPSGKLGNKIGVQKIFMIGVLMTFLSIFLMLLCSFVDHGFINYVVAPLCFMIMPFSWAPLIVTGTSLTSQLATMEEGSALGIFNSAYAVGIVISAFLAGGMAFSFGYRVILITAVIVAFICALLFVKLLRIKK